MKTRSAAAGVAFGVVLLFAAAAAIAEHGAHDRTAVFTEVSLEGRLVDVSCYALRRAARAEQRAEPACRDGAPGHAVGLLLAPAGDDETLYVLATPPMPLAPHLGLDARLLGKLSPLSDRLVKPERLEVRTPDGWSAVALMPDM